MAHNFVLSAEELVQLRQGMDRVIPPDALSSGAGTLETARHLIALVQSLGEKTAVQYRKRFANLATLDLDDTSDPFAQTFIDHVRDCYYGYDDTGAWADIGFLRTPRI